MGETHGKQTRKRCWALCVVAICLLSAACSPPRTRLDFILERGELRVATRNGPTTYYLGRDGETGLEYELARRYAQLLGVKLTVTVARNTSEILELLRKDKVDVAAAGLSSADIPSPQFAFGPGYQWITQQVVYRNGRKKPDSLKDIFPDQLHLVDGAISEQALERLKRAYPNLSFFVHKDRDSTDLLQLLESGDIAYTVVSSNHFAFARQIDPEIRSAFTVGDPRPLTWVMNADEDRSLINSVNGFFKSVFDDGYMAQLIDRFYGPLESFDYLDSKRFMDRVTQVLPKYRPIFEETARKTGIDWRLLAALAYQESHWNARARSPTGVRGLMMLTLDTAEHMGVEDRLDPEQSVEGGAAYLRSLRDRLPARIREPDRTWLALAAYNVGFGHLEDARILTQRDGADPDSWADVRARLPRLSQSKWYKQTRFGYARGYEPVRFVGRIRRYFNVIVQITQPDIEPTEQLVDAAFIDSPVL